MKILLINTNTSGSITDLILSKGRAFASPGTTLTAVSGRFGGRYVADRATYAIAGHAALDAYAEHGKEADAVVLACFGDPGLLALREIAHQPVVGMAEASCLLAAEGDGNFAIVTGGERWGPMLREFVALVGLTSRLATVMTVAPTGGDIARDPEAAYDMLAGACEACVTEHGASSVILGGAALAGVAAEIRDRVSVPLIDSLEASIKAAERLGTATRAQSETSARRGGIETSGLSRSLSSLLRDSVH